MTGDEGVGKVITITLDFSEVVTLKGGAPSLILNDSPQPRRAKRAGTSALTFTYKVGASDLNEAALAVTGVANGTTIEDLAGNIADLSGASATFEGLKIDTSIPTVVSAAADPGDFDEDVGGKVTITVNLSEPGYVSGRPLLILNDGGIAKYASGSGTDMLTFDYTVGSGDSDVSALAIVDFQVAGHIKDGAGKSFDLSGALTTFDGLQIKSGSSAYTYTTLNDGDPRSVSTYAQGINNVGQVVGLGSTQDGFLYSDRSSIQSSPIRSLPSVETENTLMESTTPMKLLEPTTTIIWCTALFTAMGRTPRWTIRSPTASETAVEPFLRASTTAAKLWDITMTRV